MDQQFPLRTTFFRGPPLNQDVVHATAATAMDNAHHLESMAFNEQWRYVPPEKDGVQYRKDTSNMQVSCRYLRCTTIVKCLATELTTMFKHTSTDVLRHFFKKFMPKAFVDAILLHTLRDEEDELITVKWGVVDAGLTIRRDVCVVDYVGQTTLPNSAEKEPMFMWCITSIDGNNVGCLSMKESHGIARANVSRVGLFWRQISSDEVEVVFCGSFKSKAAKHAGNLVIASLNRLNDMIEELRLSYQNYAHHSTWVKDNERAACILCMRNFHTLRRKHHCRLCGEVICYDCSVIKSVDLPVLGANKIRLCKVCCVRAKSVPLHPTAQKSIVSLTQSDFEIERHRSTSSNPLDDRSPLAISFSSNPEADGPLRSQSHYHHNHHNFDNFSTKGHCGEAIRMSLASLDDKTVAEERAEWRRKLDAFEPLIFSGTSCESMFALLCDLACETLGCPIAIVCMIELVNGAPTEKLKSTLGLENCALQSEIKTFIDKIMGTSPTVILDAGADNDTMDAFDRVPVLRFFAGCPIFSRNGVRLGYICVADTRKRTSLGATCSETMERLAMLASVTMEQRLATPAATHPLPSGHVTHTHDANGYHTSPHTAAEIRMRDLLLKTLMTQQQIASAPSF
ncbi:hypothetical protein THRCLA_05255 [Thraustotheca clavata]|uniref:FYVE-type domain-containing protein n=1 Tax=Thraustotheca clavata TaxID=74557 RepID=A0A1V9ZWG3_9STRA|nr:hypothetical protein THRCLA_05255 [Thraustotheca clavata]